MFNFIKKKVIENRIQDEILYEYVLEEIEKGIKIKGLWGKAYAYSEGNDSKTNALYMKYRVQSIKDYFTSLTIAYEEMSKQDIYSLIQENKHSIFTKKELSFKEINFLENYDCNEKSINVEINNDIIKIRKGKTTYYLDRNSKEEYKIDV